jgi:hypothetical protein
VSIVFQQIHTDNEAVNNSIRCLIHLNSSETRMWYAYRTYSCCMPLLEIREVSKACIGRVTHYCTHRLIRDAVSLHGVAGVAVTPVTVYSVQNDIMPNEFSRARNFNDILIVTLILCTCSSTDHTIGHGAPHHEAPHGNPEVIPSSIVFSFLLLVQLERLQCLGLFIPPCCLLDHEVL